MAVTAPLSFQSEIFRLGQDNVPKDGNQAALYHGKACDKKKQREYDIGPQKAIPLGVPQHLEHLLPVTGVIYNDHERDGQPAQEIESCVTLYILH